MTEFKSVTTGEVIIAKNNTNSVSRGDYIEVAKKNKSIKGKVLRVSHVIEVWYNAEGKERDLHDIIIEIK